MATVKEIREWLATKPQDYVVQAYNNEYSDWDDVTWVIRAVPPDTPSTKRVPDSEYQ